MCQQLRVFPILLLPALLAACRVFVDEGTPVRAGQLLFSINWLFWSCRSGAAIGALLKLPF